MYAARPWKGKLYGRKWRKAREWHLANAPLCVMCSTKGRTVAASIVDHKTPHRGDPALFWDSENWQSLCKPCHDSTKQRDEWLQDQEAVVSLDGYPLQGDW